MTACTVNKTFCFSADIRILCTFSGFSESTCTTCTILENRGFFQGIDLHFRVHVFTPLIKNEAEAGDPCLCLYRWAFAVSALFYRFDQFFKYLACGETVRGALRAAEIYPEVFAESYKLVVFDIRGNIQDLPR